MRSLISLLVFVAIASVTVGSHAGPFELEPNTNRRLTLLADLARPGQTPSNQATPDPTKQTNSGGGPSGGGTTSGGGSGPRKRTAAAASLIDEVMRGKNPIPRQLLDKAAAIAIFPGTTSNIFGGAAGSGVVVPRITGGWGTPVFYDIGVGGIGAQYGGTQIDYIFLIMTNEELRNFSKVSFELDPFNSTAGPIGRTAGDSPVRPGILVYARSKRNFVGASNSKITIRPDDGLNRAVYGRPASTLFANPTKAPPTLSILPQTLSRYSAGKQLGF